MNKLFGLILMSFISLNVHAIVVWDESVDGDLNDDWGDPSLLIAHAGSNVIIGSVGKGESDWLDHFRFDVSGSLSLAKIVLNDYTGDGTTFVLQPIEKVCNCGSNDVYSRIYESTVGMDSGSRFLPKYRNDLSQYYSLIEMNYSTYAIDFIFESTAVLEPSTLGLFFVCLLVLFYRRALLVRSNIPSDQRL